MKTSTNKWMRTAVVAVVSLVASTGCDIYDMASLGYGLLPSLSSPWATMPLDLGYPGVGWFGVGPIDQDVFDYYNDQWDEYIRE